MSSPKQNVRIVIAALCCVAHLASLPQVSPLMLVVFMHGGHELQVMAHDGHEDLLLHHDDDDDASSEHQAGHEQTHAEEHDGHHHHHDHLVCLSSINHAVTAGELIIRAPLVSACALECSEVGFVAQWKTTGQLTRPRPPPLIRNGMLVCLRTTVLVV